MLVFITTEHILSNEGEMASTINTGRVSILFKFYSVNEQIPFSA